MKQLTEKITAIWRSIPRAIRSGWITAWVTFTGTLLTILTSLLPELANAISTKNFEPFYNGLSNSAALAIAAATGFFSGLVNAVYRWLRPIAQAYQTTPPKDDEMNDDKGYAAPQWLVYVILFGVAIIVVWFILTRIIDINDEDAIRSVLMR